MGGGASIICVAPCYCANTGFPPFSDPQVSPEKRACAARLPSNPSRPASTTSAQTGTP